MATDVTVLGDGAIEELRQALMGPVVAPGDADYERSRRVWNGVIDRHPALVARCASTADVVEAVRFARSERLLTAVRGGGHNVAGYGTCDGGIVIDLSAMRGVEVDAERRLARVQGGALWSDVDTAAQAHGLGVTGGLISHTGVGGLTLGGGIGWLMRKHGLTCDNLLAADLVTADGMRVRASGDENPELLWALRGGGGNFGVVTSFEFALHPVGSVYGGGILQPLEQAGEFLRAYREWAPDAPDELTTLANFITVPPAPSFPADLHGRKVMAVGFCYSGSQEDGDRAIEPLRRMGAPVFETAALMPYAVRNTLQDPSAPPGLCSYWKSDYLTGLDDALIDLLVECARQATSPFSMIHVYQLGGAVARTDEDSAAYAHRSAPFVASIIAAWMDPSEDATAHVDWTRQYWSRLRPHTAGTYVNFLGDEGADRVRDAYGDDTYARLAAVKAAFDPTNLFRLNHNVEPSS